MYEETADGVRAVCAYERKNTEYSTEYKSYYVDRQNQLVGIGVTDNTKEEPSERGRYLLLYFDGYQLVELADLSLIGAPAYKRGFYEEGYLYAFAPGGLFAVQKVLD